MKKICSVLIVLICFTFSRISYAAADTSFERLDSSSDSKTMGAIFEIKRAVLSTWFLEDLNKGLLSQSVETLIEIAFSDRDPKVVEAAKDLLSTINGKYSDIINAGIESRNHGTVTVGVEFLRDAYVNKWRFLVA